MATEHNLPTIIGTLLGGGFVGSFLTQWLKNKGVAFNRQSDELSQYRAEQRADIQRLEAKLDKATERITGLEKDLVNERSLRRAFQDRVLNMIEFRLHDKPAWIDLARELRKERRQEEGAAIIQRKRRILLVDDEHDITKVLTLALKGEGYDAYAANSGGDALQQIMTKRQLGQPFDLLLLDYAMPDMDGGELAMAVRRMEVNELCPVAITFLTGNHEIPTQILQEIGVSGVLQKPIEIHELSRHIHEALQDVE